MSPWSADGGVGDIKHDSVFLLSFGKPASKLKRSHSTEGMSTQNLHDSGLIEVARWRSHSLERMEELRREFGDMDVSVDRDDSNSLEKLALAHTRPGLERKGEQTLRFELFRPISDNPFPLIAAGIVVL